MLGAVAAIQISKDHGLQFGWHWTILVVAAAVILWNTRFWNLVWELQETAIPKTKSKLVFHLCILAVLGLGSFLYPIRYIEQSHWNGIIRGLITAITFLLTAGWLLYKSGKGLVEIDDIELKQQAEAAQEPAAGKG